MAIFNRYVKLPEGKARPRILGCHVCDVFGEARPIRPQFLKSCPEVSRCESSCRSKAMPDAMDLESCAVPYEMRLARDGHAYKEPW